jgi:hypothetical protein
VRAPAGLHTTEYDIIYSFYSLIKQKAQTRIW